MREETLRSYEDQRSAAVQAQRLKRQDLIFCWIGESGVANIWLEHNIMCYSLKNKGILCPCNSLTLVLKVASQSTIQCLFDLQKELFRLKGEMRTKWWAHNLQEHPLHKSS